MLERVPSQVLEHGGNTAFSGVVIHDISCCIPLDGFNLGNTFLGRWRPYTTGILCYWPHKGVVTSGFNFTWTATKIAAEEAKGSHSFHGYGIQMLVPGQVVAKFHTKIFGWWDCLKMMAMDRISKANWVAALSDVEDLAFFRMKFHEPLTLPLLKCI